MENQVHEPLTPVVDLITDKPKPQLLKLVGKTLIIILALYALVDIGLLINARFQPVESDDSDSYRINSQKPDSNQVKPIPTTIVSTNPATDLTELPVILRQITDSVFVGQKSFTLSNPIVVWWVNPEGWSLTLPSDKTIGMAIKLDQTSTQELLADIRVVFTKAGYVKNNQTSSTGLNDDTFYDYLESYEKGDSRCNININPDVVVEDSGHNVTINCSQTPLTQAETTQIPLLTALGATKVDNKMITATVTGEDQNWIIADISGRRSGYQAYFYKTQGVYKLVHSGQDVPPCSVFGGYQPSELITHCIDD